MILWTSKETTEGNEESWRPRAHRWALQVGLFFAGLVLQYQPRGSNKWHDIDSDQWLLSFDWQPRFWMFGVHHVYWDGPHCFVALGPLRFQWRPRDGWCEKCMPRNKDGAQ